MMEFLSEMGAPLSRQHREIVELIAAGLTRWAIARRLGVNENTVRQHIRVMCNRFDCPMRDLPEVLGVTAPDDEEFTFLPHSNEEDDDED